MAKKLAPRDDPSTPSLAYQIMAPKWNMISTLLNGTAAMRAAGNRYLPQHPHESVENYKERLATATLLNYTEQTLDSLVGKPFSDPVHLIDGSPKELIDWSDDIDKNGNNLQTFCREWFRQGIAKGYAHVLIDYPRLEVEGENRTLADDRAEQNRPYWVLLKPENVIYVGTDKTPEGRDVITQVRIWQEVIVPDKFAERVVQRIKVLYIGYWDLYELRKEKNSNEETWVLIDSGTTALNFIPFVTFYSSKDADGICKPPLEDLAYLNVRHWQSTADQMNILTVARFPMLAVSGAHDAPSENVMAIGPRQLLATRAENGKFYYVEHEGRAIDAGDKDLQNIEQYMAGYGAEFLRKRPGSSTATARALDSAEATSPLQDMTLRFKDAVELAFWYMQQWENISGDAEIVISTDFGPDEVTDVDLRALLEARRNRDISRKTFTNELKRRGLLADDFDVEKDVEEMENEPEIESPFATGRNTDGSGAANVENEAKKVKAGKKPNSGGSS